MRKLSKEGPTCHMISMFSYFSLNQFRETLTLTPIHLRRISIDQCWALKWPLAKKLKYGLFFNFPTHIPITPQKTRRRTRRTLLRSVWSERTTAINDEDISIFVTGQAVISLTSNMILRTNYFSFKELANMIISISISFAPLSLRAF